MIEIGIFKTYSKGHFSFTIEDGNEIIFEEINRSVLYEYDLKKDKSLIGKLFYISYKEVFDLIEEDFVIYRIEQLKLI